MTRVEPAAHWSTGLSQGRAASRWAAVLAAHIGLLVAWHVGLHRPRPPAADHAQPTVQWLNLPAPVAQGMRTPETGTRTERPRPVAPPAAPPAVARAPQTSPPPDPAMATPHPPPSDERSREPATGEPGTTLRLLESPASRLALRDMVRQPLLSERAASATGIVPLTGAQRMAEAASAAGRGDCGRGEFLGGGMGVLSLPFLAAAVATGQCRR